MTCTFLTVIDNGNEGKYKTYVELDIEGNQREIIDTLGRKIMVYDYDMIGNKIKQSSIDAGIRWMLNDVAGKPVYGWDNRAHLIHTIYDELQRPIKIFLKEGSDILRGEEIIATENNDILVEHIIYGETMTSAESKNRNVRDKIIKHFDQAGIATNEEYDFKGNILHTTRQLTKDYKNTINWSSTNTTTTRVVELQQQIYHSFFTFDVLNRPTKITYPDHTSIHYNYNESNLLKKIEVNLHGEENQKTIFVNQIDYNEKGQRTYIEYGSGLIIEDDNVIRKHGIITTYEYDPLTFRLINIITKRESDILQNLHYTYDPIGNITSIKDDAQQSIFFRNHIVEPITEYTYDPIYRLVMANGREHLGQNNSALAPPVPTGPTDQPRVNLLHPNDRKMMGRYCEQYIYDEVGNIKEISHNTKCLPSSPGWTRNYHYDISKNNRLRRTTVNGVTDDYSYDNHGNIIEMGHLPLMNWDFKDQLQYTSMQKVDVDSGKKPIITYYIYDSSGQRIRKVTESEADVGETPRLQKERIYLGEFEVYHEYNGNNPNNIKLKRETLHIMDDEKRIAIVDTLTQENQHIQSQNIRYQFTDLLGSSNMELDENNQIISYEEYYPYGSSSYQGGRNVTETNLKRFRYVGKERDEENGFYYYGARYYLPWLGRWLNCDPILNHVLQNGEPRKDATSVENDSLLSNQRIFSRHYLTDSSDNETSDETDDVKRLFSYVFSFCNPIVNIDPDGKDPVKVGYIYTLRSTVKGEEVVYTGHTARELAQRLYKDKHKWSEIIKSKTTTIELHEIKAILDVKMSSRQSLKSAIKEALSAAEQVIFRSADVLNLAFKS